MNSIYHTQDLLWKPGCAPVSHTHGSHVWLGKSVFKMGGGRFCSVALCPKGCKELVVAGFSHLETVRFVAELNEAIAAGSGLRAVFERWVA